MLACDLGHCSLSCKVQNHRPTYAESPPYTVYKTITAILCETILAACTGRLFVAIIPTGKKVATDSYQDESPIHGIGRDFKVS